MLDMNSQDDLWAAIHKRLLSLRVYNESEARASVASDLDGPQLLEAIVKAENIDHSRFFPQYREEDYLALNPDLANAGVSLIRHYVESGVNEKRYARLEVLSRDANRLIASGFFDTEYYLSQLRKSVTDVAPVIHYLLEGWMIGLYPSPHFDQANYVETYPQAKNYSKPAILYYLEHGKAFRHVTSKEDLVKAHRIIAQGDFFDLHFYERQVGHSFADRDNGIRHYCLYGYQEGLRPNAGYCDHTYAERNPDLWEQTLPLACHYLEHGRSEGRAARPWVGPNSMYEGRRPFRRNRKTIIIVCHEASLTGAPLLGLELVKQYAETHNVIAVLQQGGKIAEEFVEYSWFMVQLLDHANSLANIIQVYKNQTEIEACILNSVECAHFGAAATRHGIPSITLIHEYSEYVDLLRTIEAVNFSNAIVFPAEAVKDSFVKRCDQQLSLSLSNLHVAHQGRLSSRTPVKSAGRWTLDDILLHLSIDPDTPADERPMIVVGAGASQLRKGVDLFIQTAAFYKDKFGPNIRFVWVGSRKRSDKDIYEAMLDNMVDTLNLRDVFNFIPHQPDLETIFEAADIFYLSSRLDPFPNVFVDAVWAGLDCVAYKSISGAAEFIDRNLPRSRVVGGMDTVAAARAINEIVVARPSSKRDKVAGRQLFGFSQYVEKLNEVIAEARDRRDFEHRLASTLERDVPMQHSFITGEPDLGHLRKTRMVQVARGLAFGGLRRTIRAGVDHSLAGGHTFDLGSDISHEAVSRLNTETHQTLVCYTHLDKHAGYESLVLKKPIAIHLHLYYWKIIHEMLVGFKWAFDDEEHVHLFISTGSESDKNSILSLLSWRANVTVEVVENRGRDVLPLLAPFKEALRNGGYQLLGHLHGKKSEWVGGNVGDIWREFCFNHLGASAGVFESIYEAFERNPRLGLVFPEDPNVIGWNKNRPHAQSLMRRMGYDRPLPEHIRFPLGTMFWARTQILEPLWNAEVAARDVPPEPLPEDGTILHAVERLLPTVCEYSGYEWMTVHVADTVLR